MLKAADLVYHQRHEGRDDENDALFKSGRTGALKLVIEQERKELIADRLAITGWKPHEDIASIQLLQYLKLLVLEHYVLLSQVGTRVG